MRKTKKTLAVLFMALLLTTTAFMAMPSTVNAANPGGGSAGLNATFDPSAYSFYGSCNWGTHYYDGNYMKVQATCWASDGVSRQVTISVYVADTGITYNCITYTDGYLKESVAIPIYGGSDAQVYATCSDSSVEITADLYMYSYY